MMKTTLGIWAIAGFLALGLVGNAVANGAVRGDDPAIKVSPNVVVLAKVSVLTVHTNIPFSPVDLGTLSLNGASPTLTKPDNRGHLVAKFAAAEVSGLVPGRVTLALTGMLADGTGFQASDSVRVK